MKSVSGKIVWITGASSGIGERIAYQLAEEGATLIISARREDKLNAIKADCQARFNANIIVYPLDVSKPKKVNEAVTYLFSKLEKIDVLINSAGFGHTESILTYDLSKAENMFKVNVLGLMYMSQLVAIEMVKHKAGHIINISSMAGKIATPKSSVYSATKFAVIGFSNALRLELKPHKVDVTTINPGPVDTEFFDQFDPSGEYTDNIRSFLLTADQVAEKAIKVIKKPKREVNMPIILGVAHRVYTLFPNISDFLTRTVFNKK